MAKLEKYYKGLAQAITILPQAVIIVDSNFEIQYANPSAPEFFGYPKISFSNIDLDSIIFTRYRKSLSQKIMNLMQDKKGKNGRSATTITTVVRHDGSKVPCNVTLIQMPTDKGGMDVLLRFDMISNDIDKDSKEFKQLESAAMSSEILHALDILEDSVVILDKDFRYQFVNSQGWKVLKKDPSEILGRVVWDLRPDLIGTEWHKAAIKAMETQQTFEIEEYYTRSRRWYITKFIPAARSLVAQMKDVTELKETQQINKQLMGTLEEAMEVYWSDKNQARRKHKKPQHNHNS